jgi:threonine aldolase
MRRAMAGAEVGDDCYGEDPTVNRLQDIACELLGCEAALYVPTGTMANQIAVKVLAAAGGEVICDQDCHLIHHESGATAMLSQVQLRGLPGEWGILDPTDVRRAIRPPDPYQPRSALVSVENTHNTAGGTVWSLDRFRAVAAVARDASLPFYCDGARLFNAVVATGTSVRDYAAEADLVSISLYKGLAAPMGSLVCGGRELVREAWRYRRIFGGALRQAGVVAAAGIIGLQTMVDRLAEDHANARRFAEGIAEASPDGCVPLERVQTNMVLFDAAAAGLEGEKTVQALREEGVLAGIIAGDLLRFVTHKDVSSAAVGRAIRGFASSLKRLL